MIETFIKPMIYNKNHPGSAEQIAGGTYKNFDYYTWCDNFVKYIDKKGWFIGWDYAHFGDYIDCGDAALNNMFPNDKKWTTEEIVEECKNVIDQIVEKYHE